MWHLAGTRRHLHLHPRLSHAAMKIYTTNCKKKKSRPSFKQMKNKMSHLQISKTM